MLIEQINHKCIRCRPDWDCAKTLGRNAEIAGKRYENRCAYMNIYKFISNNMNILTLYTPRWSHPPEPTGFIPLNTVKKLILARKGYIIKTIAV